MIYSESLKKSRENGRDPVFGERMDEHILELKKTTSPQTQKAQRISSKVNKNKFISRYITEKLKNTEGKEIFKKQEIQGHYRAIMFLRSKGAPLRWQ